MAMRRKGERVERTCPFWHELATDFLCVYPQTGYCVGAEHGKPRTPSRATAQRYCAGNFGQCERFQRQATQGP